MICFNGVANCAAACSKPDDGVVLVIGTGLVDTNFKPAAAGPKTGTGAGEGAQFTCNLSIVLPLLFCLRQCLSRPGAPRTHCALPILPYGWCRHSCSVVQPRVAERTHLCVDKRVGKEAVCAAGVVEFCKWEVERVGSNKLIFETTQVRMAASHLLSLTCHCPANAFQHMPSTMLFRLSGRTSSSCRKRSRSSGGR